MKNAFVINKEESAIVDEGTILKFALNFLPKGVRLETLEGQEYTVVPMVILTEGVHSGSMGPLYYSKEELSKTPVIWNQKPVVVYHPTMNGVGISACEQTVINSRKVGVMMNTRFEKGKLKSEAWIRNDRADTVDDRIMAAVNAGEMMELSTGVFVDVEQIDGEFNGKAYMGIARNFRPDHLALLPDQIGACSIADGAGFLRNAARNNLTGLDELLKVASRLGLSTNEFSHSDIREALATALRAKFPTIGAPTIESSVWVLDVFSNFVVYERDGQLYRLGYTSNDSEVQLSDETPVMVERVSEYRTVQNTENESNIMNKETQKLVDAIIGNAKWTQVDKEKLGLLPTEKLSALAELKKHNPKFQFTLNEDQVVTPEPEAPATEPEVPATDPTPTPAPAPEPAPAPAPAPAGNVAPKTAAEYISLAPKEIQEVLGNGLHIYNEEKAKMVQDIVANVNNTFTPAELNARQLNELRKMAQLMGAKIVPQSRTPYYAGQAPTPTENSEREEPLELPTMDFSK